MLKELLNLKRKFSRIVTISSLKSFYFTLFTLTIVAFLELGGIALLYPYIDFILNPENIFDNTIFNFFYDLFNFKNTNSFLIYLGIFLILFIILSSFLGAYSKVLINKYVWGANIKLVKLSFKITISKPYLELKKRNSNKLTNDIINEVSVFTNGLMVPIFDIIPRIMILILLLIFILYIDFLSTIIIIGILGFIYFLIYNFFNKEVSIMSEKRFEMARSLFDYVNTSLKSIKDIKVNNLEGLYLEKISKPATTYSNLNQIISIFSLMPKYILEAFIFTIAILFLIFNLTDNEKIIELIPLISLYALTAFKLMPHINGIFVATAKIKFNYKSLDVVYNHFDLVNTIKKYKFEKLNNFNCIDLKDVFFVYDDDDTELLKNINFKINKNDFLFITGESGSGKSTLFEIILGLIEPSSGQLFFNNKPSKSKLSQFFNIGYVPQEIMLFEGSFKENVALFDNNPDINQLKKIIELTHLKDVVESIGGLDGKIYENGKNLSHGQRQRVAIARALYNEPEILFFDESTSALDNKTEELIIKNLINKYTIVLISHNKSLIKYSNKSLTLKNKTV